MVEPLLAGVVTALSVVLPRFLYVHLFLRATWTSPVTVLGVGALAMVAQKFLVARWRGNAHYDGVSDLIVQIHSPAKTNSSFRWAFQGLISFLLNLFGGSVGPEGAAVELVQALKLQFRNRSSLWFERKRRTDSASSLASGISGAFGAPFTGLLVPVELGIGGSTLTCALSAFIAFLAVKFLSNLFSLDTMDYSVGLTGIRFSSWVDWVGIVVLGGIVGLVGSLMICFFRYIQQGLFSLLQTQSWMRPLAGAVFLSLLVFIDQPTHISPSLLFEQIFSTQVSIGEVGLLFLVRLFSLSMVIGAFGTVGIFWPLFLIGGLLGLYLYLWASALPWMGGLAVGMTFAPGAAMVIGGAALWAVFLGAPLSGAVLAFELTQNVSILLPAWLAAILALKVRRLLKMRSWVDTSLSDRGMQLIEGRSAAILSGLSVRDVMVTDFESISEHEPLSELRFRILKSKYPFFPVVNAKGGVVGLLTADRIQEDWIEEPRLRTTASLANLLEAKDLIRRAGFRPEAVRVNDTLVATAGRFNEVPCVPVLGLDDRLQGLLFDYSVRLAYDRECSRRSMIREGEGSASI